jgi:hypothetical protein
MVFSQDSEDLRLRARVNLETIFLHRSLSGGVGVTMKKRPLRSPGGETASAIGP